jgi:hypothetical protein
MWKAIKSSLLHLARLLGSLVRPETILLPVMVCLVFVTVRLTVGNDAFSTTLDAARLAVGSSALRLPPPTEWTIDGGPVTVTASVQVPGPDAFPSRLMLFVERVSFSPALATGAAQACVTAIEATVLVDQGSGAKDESISSVRLVGPSRDTGTSQSLATQGVPPADTSAGSSAGQTSRSDSRPPATEQTLSEPKLPLCTSNQVEVPNTSSQTGGGVLNRSVELNWGQARGTANSTYPYDTMTIWAQLQVEGQVLDKSGKLVRTFKQPASMILTVQPGAWIEEQAAAVSPLTYGQQFKSGIQLKRTDLARRLLPVIAVLVLFLVVVVLPFLEPGQATQLAIALGLGFFTIRKEFQPANLPGTTAIDMAVMTGYIFLIVSVVASYLISICKKRTAASQYHGKWACFQWIFAALRDWVLGRRKTPPVEVLKNVDAQHRSTV